VIWKSAPSGTVFAESRATFEIAKRPTSGQCTRKTSRLIDSDMTNTAIQTILNFVFGYDFFISYSHRDGQSYVKELRDRLEKVGFKVFLDVSEYAAGIDLRRDTVRQITKSRKLLIVGRPGALVSNWVNREMDVALSNGKIPIVINVNSSIEQYEMTSTISKTAIEREWLRIEEHIADYDGAPSDNTVNELVHAFNNTRQETKRLRVLMATSAVLAILTGIALWQSLVARMSERLAKSNEQLAKSNEKIAIGNESRALAALSQLATSKRNYADSVILAVAAWPRAGDEERPMLQQTVDALSNSLPS
jgi:hypothetical protein